MNLAENISNAFKVVRETHAAVGKLLDSLTGKYDRDKYVLYDDRFMRWNSDRDYKGWCYQTFQLAFQRLEDGNKLGNGFLNAPIYIVEINFWQFDTPKIVVAKMDYGDLSAWVNDYISPANYWRYAEPLHFFKDMFEKNEADEKLTEDVYEITPVAKHKFKVESKYNGFKSALVTTLELIDINGDNYKAKIFGAIEKLSAF